MRSASCVVLSLAWGRHAALADETPRLKVDTQVSYTSVDWSDWPELEAPRDIHGTMNGPREVYAFDDDHGPYDTDQYAVSFAALEAHAVRFNDMNYLQGGYNSTSITQIFTAWPLTNAALGALDVDGIAALAADDANFVWDGVDYNVGAACATPSVDVLDFRIGDTYQVTNSLNAGEPVPMSPNGDTLTFPAAWQFPTDALSDNGIALWAAVAARLAARVKTKLCADVDVVFDILTEIYIDSDGDAHFWPHGASEYASLFAAATSAIRAALGDDDGVKFAGPNVLLSNSANEDFLTTFVAECHALGYAACPLDVATFHYFSPDYTKATSMATFVQSTVWHEFHDDDDFDVPRLAVTAWGLHGSGAYDYNGNITGAAYVTEHLITLQGTPVDFAIFYKFDGGNCGEVGYPCLVMAETGELKPNAEPFVLHARLLAVGGDRRLAADCYYCRGGASLAALSDDGSLGVLVAGADGGVAPPTQLLVANWGATCGEAESVLAVASVVVAKENVGGLAETQVAGYFSDSTFYESGDDSGAPYELPIEVDENNGYYSALLTLTCGSGGKTERADGSKDGPTALA